ncbi:MAG: aminodeoxychorismate/anthranilate synthase component II [Henriciella sp.]|nr:aminodeoxychorismate/anthranilate synthase component II [Henriciella sp.]
MSGAKQILVIDNYDSFTWNLVHYLEEIGARTQVIRNDEVSAAAALDMKPDGIVLSPGPCTPKEAGICVDVVQKAASDLPILGVCLGHQSIGAAEGGDIITAQEIRHGKISQIRHDNGPLFQGLPETYDVVRYHSLSIKPENLPDTLIADAFTADGEIMAVRHTSRPVFGVQFHPESILTEHGHALLKNWLNI